VPKREVNNSITKHGQIHNNNGDIKAKSDKHRLNKVPRCERDGQHKVHSNDLIITGQVNRGGSKGGWGRGRFLFYQKVVEGGWAVGVAFIWSARQLEHNSCFWLFAICEWRVVPPKRDREASVGANANDN